MDIMKIYVMSNVQIDSRNLFFARKTEIENILNFQKSKTGLFLTLPSMPDYYQLLTPYTAA